MTKTIRQTVAINAPPHEVYEALMDSKKHSAFTGATAKVVRRVGGFVSTFDGWAMGKILKLQRDAKIVQTWRTDDFAEADRDSKVMFVFRGRGRGTALTMVHSGVPDAQYADVKQGWTTYYWKPLKAYLER